MPQSCEFGLCKSKSKQMSEGEAKMGAAVEVCLGLGSCFSRNLCPQIRTALLLPAVPGRSMLRHPSYPSPQHRGLQRELRVSFQIYGPFIYFY